MTRFVVDATIAVDLATRETGVPDRHKLLAPTLLRSQTLSILHESVCRGDISDEVARKRLAWINKLPIRLLGDAVLRRRAWEIANQLGWKSTYNAEYVALTQLQGDVLLTLDKDFALDVKGVVATGSVEALGRR